VKTPVRATLYNLKRLQEFEFLPVVSHTLIRADLKVCKQGCLLEINHLEQIIFQLDGHGSSAKQPRYQTLLAQSAQHKQCQRRISRAMEFATTDDMEGMLVSA
jgi:hypothetical protein